MVVFPKWINFKVGDQNPRSSTEIVCHIWTCGSALVCCEIKILCHRDSNKAVILAYLQQGGVENQ